MSRVGLRPFLFVHGGRSKISQKVTFQELEVFEIGFYMLVPSWDLISFLFLVFLNKIILSFKKLFTINKPRFEGF